MLLKLQCCAGTWAILLKYKFCFLQAPGLTVGIALLCQWLLTLAARWNHLDGFKNNQCLDCTPWIMPQLILGGGWGLIKVPWGF